MLHKKHRQRKRQHECCGDREDTMRREVQEHNKKKTKGCHRVFHFATGFCNNSIHFLFFWRRHNKNSKTAAKGKRWCPADCWAALSGLHCPNLNGDDCVDDSGRSCIFVPIWFANEMATFPVQNWMWKQDVTTGLYLNVFIIIPLNGVQTKMRL